MKANNLYSDPVSELRRKYAGKPVEDAIRDAKEHQKKLLETKDNSHAEQLNHIDEMVHSVYSQSDIERYHQEVYNMKKGGEIIENYRRELEEMTNTQLAQELEEQKGFDFKEVFDELEDDPDETKREDYIDSLVENYQRVLHSRGELATGGEIPALPSSYFQAMNLSALPAKAQEYIKNEILADNDIDLLPENNEDFVSIKNLVAQTFPDAFPQPKPVEPEPPAEPIKEEPKPLTTEDIQAALDGAEIQLEMVEGEEKQNLQDFVDGLKVMLESMMMEKGGEVDKLGELYIHYGIGDVADRLNSLSLDKLGELYVHYGIKDEGEFKEGKPAIVKKIIANVAIDALERDLVDIMKRGGEARSIKSDKQRKAKPEGYRFRGNKPSDYKRPSKADIKDGENVYYEGRKNRSDKNIKKKLKRGGSVNNFTDYYLVVNLDERGEYSASVYDPKDKSIFEIESAEQARQMVDDGFLKYKPDEDLNRLTKYLMELNIIPNGSQIYSQDEFESKIRDQYKGEMKRGGRIPSALAREKKYTSEQDHEQNYRKNRVSKVKYYKTGKAKRGAEMPAGANKWREHLAGFRKANPELAMKDAMKGAAKTYSSTKASA